MSKPPLQSRKICFVELEEEARDFFDEALAAHDVVFARRLEGVPSDTEVLSVFIGEPVGEEFLEAHPGLRLIATRSTGCDHLDLEACRRRGITVTNVGNYGENTVAEHAFAFLLALSRRLGASAEAVRTGKFNRSALRGVDLRGKTLGVVGAGRVGLHVIRIAAGFGMDVLAYDAQPHPYLEELLDFHYTGFEDLLARSDFITLHVPLTDATRHMINRETLALCRPGVFLVNTARGGLLDTSAVIDALEAGRVAGLGLDVLEDERVFRPGGTTDLLGAKIAERVRSVSSHPAQRESSPARLAEFSRLVAQSRLLNRPDVVLTPHVAFNSDEAARRLRDLTLENILNHLAGRPLACTCP